jgi:hypothetical protein
MNKNWSNNSYTLLDIAPSELAAYICDIPLHKTGTREKKVQQTNEFRKNNKYEKKNVGTVSENFYGKINYLGSNNKNKKLRRRISPLCDAQLCDTEVSGSTVM